MKTSGTSDVVLPLTARQKCVCNVIMGALLVIAGLILVLAGADVIHVSARDIAAPTVLFGFGTAVLATAIIAKNALSMWLAGVVITCGLTSLLDITTIAGYAELYPLYVAAPGIGCLFAIWYAESKLPQLKALLFFGCVGGILALGSTDVCGYGMVAGLLAAFVGLCIISIALESYIGKSEQKDEKNDA